MTSVMMVLEATAGGTARHVAELARGCHHRGMAVQVVCATNRDPAFRETLNGLRMSGIAIAEVDMRREFHPIRDTLAAVRLRRLIADAAPDVVHLHSSKAGAVGRLAVAGLGAHRPRVVYTPHAYAFLTQEGFLRRRIYRFGERALLPWTDKVVAVSNSEGRATLGLSGTGRIEVIPNGVNARLPSPQKAGRRPFRIGWLGRLVWQKDPESAVRVSFVLATLGIEHELLLGGEGVDRERVERALQECRATRWVRMPGFVRDTEAFHAAIDVLLMTSRSEGLPYVGLDAMAHGVPIVGFDVPGIQDLVEHGVTGLLASRGDPGGLAAHLARLARDEDLRKRLGAAARLRVLTQFQFEKQIDRLCELYQSLASNCPSVGLPARAPA